MASFREINYAVRPAKSVERKMMVDAFRRLEMGWPLASYRYIGMGSVYFADFQLFHQSLGIEEMTSIERETHYETRFRFNRPFGCVQMQFGESSDVLGQLTWNQRSLIWLDYDGKLGNSIISDLQTATQKVLSGSVVVVSVNVEADRPPSEINNSDEVDEWRLKEFANRIGETFVPSGLAGEELRGSLFSLACWRVLNASVTEQLAKRNGRSELRPDTMLCRQIFHFRYQDGAAMLTVGWHFFSNDDKSRASLCAFEGGFFREKEVPFTIEAPILTPKEIRHLNSHLPDGPPVDKAIVKQLERATGIGATDINKFAAVYRYYPQYSEIVL